MIDEVDTHPADEVDGEKLGLEGGVQLLPPGDPAAVGAAELAASVDRCGPHQVAHVAYQIAAGLPAAGQALHHVIEDPAAPVGPRQDQFAGPESPGLLAGRVRLEAFDVGGAGDTVEERERGVPDVGDDPVGSLPGVDDPREAHEAVGPVPAVDGMEGAANPVVIEIEAHSLEAPAFPDHAADQLAHETQPRGEGCSHAFEAHDLIWRAQLRKVFSCRHRVPVSSSVPSSIGERFTRRTSRA